MTKETPDKRVLPTTDGDRIAVELVTATGEAGLSVSVSAAVVADERALGDRIDQASGASRFVPLLRVVTPAADGEEEDAPLGTIVTGWSRIEFIGATEATEASIVCEAILLKEALRFDRSGQAVRVISEDVLPEGWWGGGHSTSHHWSTIELTPPDMVAAIVKIHAEATRDATDEVGELRRGLEAIIASEIREDRSRGELAARTVDLDRSLAALIDVARLSAATRSRLRRAEREVSWLWRGGAVDRAAYERVRKAHAGGPTTDGASDAEHSYLLAARQFARASETLSEEVDASYELLGGVGALAAARDAAGQATLNRIAGAAAVLATGLGTVLALYGADLAVPGMNSRPWALLSGLGFFVTLVFAALAKWSRTADDRRWWAWACGLCLVAAIALGVAAKMEPAPSAPQTELDCTAFKNQLRCSGDAATTP